MMKKLSFLQLSLSAITFLSSYSVYSQITDTGDKVGIGISNPKEKLTLPTNSEIGFSYSSGQVSQLRIKGGNVGGASGMQFTSAYTNSQGLEIIAFQFHSMNSSNGISPRVTIFNNGYVGINTLLPKSELSVKGKITAISMELTAPNTWPDYVFLPGYRLKSLAEVEDFIKENGHLPEVPSENEVKTNGFDIAEMDAALLKKIEELTLYAIEQNKKIEALQNEIEKIKQTVK